MIALGIAAYAIVSRVPPETSGKAVSVEPWVAVDSRMIEALTGIYGYGDVKKDDLMEPVFGSGPLPSKDGE